GQRMVEGVVRHIARHELFARERETVQDDRSLQIDRGGTIGVQRDDVEDDGVLRAVQAEKFGILITDLGLVIPGDRAGGDHQKGEVRVVQHLEPQKRRLFRVGEQHVLFDPLEAQQTAWEVDNVFRFDREQGQVVDNSRIHYDNTGELYSNGVSIKI